MCGSPGVVVITPRVWPRFDRHKSVGAVSIRDAAARAGEVGVQWGGMLIALVDVAAGGVCLPNFDKLSGDGAAT